MFIRVISFYLSKYLRYIRPKGPHVGLKRPPLPAAGLFFKSCGSVGGIIDSYFRLALGGHLK